MLEIYNKYKLQYDNYIILIKCGGFYIAINDDALVMYKLFKFKINDSTTFLKVGFPVNSLSKTLSVLTENEINYLVIDKDIVMMDEFKNNKYSLYKQASNYKIYFEK